MMGIPKINKSKMPVACTPVSWLHLICTPWPQWVYNTWYAALTPDKEFPAEIRHMLNSIFGELSARAAKVDARGLLLR